jgi:hypothetical protein
MLYCIHGQQTYARGSSWNIRQAFPPYPEDVPIQEVLNRAEIVGNVVVYLVTTLSKLAHSNLFDSPEVPAPIVPWFTYSRLSLAYFHL